METTIPRCPWCGSQDVRPLLPAIPPGEAFGDVISGRASAPEHGTTQDGACPSFACSRCGVSLRSDGRVPSNPLLVRVAEPALGASQDERLDAGAMLAVVGEALRRTRWAQPDEQKRHATAQLVASSFEYCREVEALGAFGNEAVVIAVQAVRSATPDPLEDTIPEIAVSSPSGSARGGAIVTAAARDLRYFEVREGTSITAPSLAIVGESDSPGASECCGGEGGECSCECASALPDVALEVRADLYLDRLSGRLHRGAGRVIAAIEGLIVQAAGESGRGRGRIPMAWSQPVWSVRDLCEIAEVEPGEPRCGHGRTSSPGFRPTPARGRTSARRWCSRPRSTANVSAWSWTSPSPCWSTSKRWCGSPLDRSIGHRR